MVYKRYIKRGGKTFGPYYYESYRDSSGNIKSRYLKDYKPRKNNLFLAIFLCSVIVLFGMFSYFYFLEGNNFSEKSDSFSNGFVNLVNPVIEKVSFFGTGFSVENSSSGDLNEEILSLEGGEESQPSSLEKSEEAFKNEEVVEINLEEENSSEENKNEEIVNSSQVENEKLEENHSEEGMFENESLILLNDSNDKNETEVVNLSENSKN